MEWIRTVLDGKAQIGSPLLRPFEATEDASAQMLIERMKILHEHGLNPQALKREYARRGIVTNNLDVLWYCQDVSQIVDRRPTVYIPISDDFSLSETVGLLHEGALSDQGLYSVSFHEDVVGFSECDIGVSVNGEPESSQALREFTKLLHLGYDLRTWRIAMFTKNLETLPQSFVKLTKNFLFVTV